MKLYKVEAAVVAATDGTILSAGADRLSVTVNPAAASRLVVTGSASQTAGNSQTATVTATDPYGNTDTGYAGNHTLTFTGANSSTGPVTAPTFRDRLAADQTFGSANTSLTFTSGVASGDDEALQGRDRAASSPTTAPSRSAGSDRLTVTVSAGAATTMTLSGTPGLGHRRHHRLGHRHRRRRLRQHGHRLPRDRALHLHRRRRGAPGQLHLHRRRRRHPHLHQRLHPEDGRLPARVTATDTVTGHDHRHQRRHHGQPRHRRHSHPLGHPGLRHRRHHRLGHRHRPRRLRQHRHRLHRHRPLHLHRRRRSAPGQLHLHRRRRRRPHLHATPTR